MGPLEGSQPRVAREMIDFGADSNPLLHKRDTRDRLCQVANGLGSSGQLGFESLELIAQLAVLTL